MAIDWGKLDSKIAKEKKERNRRSVEAVATIKSTAKKKLNQSAALANTRPIIAGGSVASYVPAKVKAPAVNVKPILNKYKAIEVGKVDLPMMGAGATVPYRLRTAEQKRLPTGSKLKLCQTRHSAVPQGSCTERQRDFIFWGTRIKQRRRRI